jgi:hypothetical protein
MTEDDSLELFLRIDRASTDSHLTKAAVSLTIKEAQEARANFTAQQVGLAAELHGRNLKTSALSEKCYSPIAHRPSPIA